MEEADSTGVVAGVSIGARVPRRGNVFSRWLGRATLRALGWRIAGEIPDAPKMVIIGAPHTSNVDALIAFAALTALGLRASVFGKHTLFRWPLGAVSRWLGLIPIERSHAHGVVEQSVRAFADNEAFLLLLAPEGTRKAAPAWKKGFWAIACGAGVPILPAALDYRRRRVVIGQPLVAGADYESDLMRLLDFYRDNASPRRPERASGPIRDVLGLGR